MAEFRAFYHATLMVLGVCCRLLNGALLRVSAMWSSSIWTCLSTTMLRLFFVLRGKCLRLVPRLYLFLGFVIFFFGRVRMGSCPPRSPDAFAPNFLKFSFDSRLRFDIVIELKVSTT